MIEVNRESCTCCGLCEGICHEHCISLTDAGPAIDETFCSTCSQCVAVCPAQALRWDGVPPAAFDASRLPSAEQLDELLKQRRSIRAFKHDRIDRALLAEIVNYGIYAPTHNHGLRAVVVDDETTIQELDRILMRFVRIVYSAFYRSRFVGSLARAIGMAEEYLLNKPKLERALDRGRAFNHPAAIVFIVGDKRVPLSVDSAQYALANMTFCAQVRGIGSCLWGNGPIFMDRSKKARQLLRLERSDRIFGALLLGRPVTRFRNKVEGRKMAIEWVGA